MSSLFSLRAHAARNSLQVLGSVRCCIAAVAVIRSCRSEWGKFQVAEFAAVRKSEGRPCAGYLANILPQAALSIVEGSNFLRDKLSPMRQWKSSWQKGETLHNGQVNERNDAPNEQDGP